MSEVELQLFDLAQPLTLIVTLTTGNQEFRLTYVYLLDIESSGIFDPSARRTSGFELLAFDLP